MIDIFLAQVAEAASSEFAEQASPGRIAHSLSGDSGYHEGH